MKTTTKKRKENNYKDHLLLFSISLEKEKQQKKEERKKAMKQTIENTIQIHQDKYNQLNIYMYIRRDRKNKNYIIIYINL